MAIGFPSDLSDRPKKKSSGCVGWSVFAIAMSIVFISALIASGNGGGESPSTSTAVSEDEVSTTAAGVTPDTATETTVESSSEAP